MQENGRPSVHRMAAGSTWSCPTLSAESRPKVANPSTCPESKLVFRTPTFLPMASPANPARLVLETIPRQLKFPLCQPNMPAEKLPGKLILDSKPFRLILSIKAEHAICYSV